MIKKIISICGIVAFTIIAIFAQTETPVELVAPTAADKELAIKAIAAAKVAQGTPAQEQANFLMNDWPSYCLKVLSSDAKVSQKSLTDARNLANEMYNVIAKGPTWPAPEKIVIPFISKPPVIDGKLNDKVWKKAVTLKKSYAYNKNELLTKPATTWKMAWDKNYIYYAFECEDADIIAPTLTRDGMPFKYDCIEIFLLPEFKKAEYWELVIGATGSVYDGLNVKKLDHWGSVSKSAENFNDLKIGTTFDGTVGKAVDIDKKYIVEVAVPFKELPSYNAGIEPKIGDTIYSIIARMDLSNDIFTTIAPFPVLSWGHNIWNYAPMELGK